MTKRIFTAVTITALLLGAMATELPAVLTEVRSIDGSGNNLVDGTIGQADTQLRRDAGDAYADGISVPRGGDPSSLPSTRAVSNAASSQVGNMFNNRGLSDWVWQWGQFLDHDIDLTDNAPVAEPFNIPVPTGDVFFDPANTGTKTIGMNRSIFDPNTGTSTANPREQINQITAYIDASNIYGSDMTRASNLRTFTDGKLVMSANDLLPFNTFGEENAGGPSSTLFLSGDIRANEQIGLTSVHVLFAREHNRLADLLKANNPSLTDEEIYQKARKIVGAEMQIITYNEFLPALLGDAAASLDPMLATYDANVNAQIANEFSTAAYRFGHTMLAPDIQLFNNDGVDVGEIALRNAFFSPQLLSSSPENLELILNGLANQAAQEIDSKVVDDVRNFLFGPPGSGGFDLASLNMQRGRDHGLPSYNEYRAALGLSTADSFADITSDVALQNALASVYGDVDDVDIWIGGLSEDHLPNSSLGELLATALIDQFTRLRDGDRFFYMFDADLLHPDILAVIDLENLRLSDVIRSNTGLTNIQANVFFVPVPEPGTITLGLMSLAAIGFRRRRRVA